MKYCYVSILVVLVWGCQPKFEKIRFFSNMTHYPSFNSDINKDALLGFDSTVIQESIEGAYLSTATNGFLNIEGNIWLQDSILYIKEIGSSDNTTPQRQILFNFCDSAKTWELKYHRNGFQFFLHVEKLEKFYNNNILDTVQVFRLNKNQFGDGFGKELMLQVSVKKGFISVLYSNKTKAYIINLLPTPNLEVHKIKELDYFRE